MSRLWTKAEDEIAIYNFGNMSYEAIGNKVGRTGTAVAKRLCNLGYTSSKSCSLYMNMREFSLAIQTDHKTITKWIEQHDMPYRNIRISHRYAKKYKSFFVDPEEFWVWAETHKNLINFSRIEKYALLPEPEWLDEERLKGSTRSFKVWTEEEDEQLYYLYYKKCLTQKEIGLKLNRSRSSVEKRMQILRNKNKVAT